MALDRSGSGAFFLYPYAEYDSRPFFVRGQGTVDTSDSRRFQTYVIYRLYVSLCHVSDKSTAHYSKVPEVPAYHLYVAMCHVSVERATLYGKRRS